MALPNKSSQSSRTIFALAVVGALLARHGASLWAEAPSTTAKPPVAFITAIDDELKPVVSRMQCVVKQRTRGINVYTGRIGSETVIAAATGGGKVNAGATTMMLLLSFHPRAVVMAGTAGGMSDDIGPGDVVISNRTAQSDYGTQKQLMFEARGTPNPVDGTRNPIFFASDPDLLAISRQLSSEDSELTRVPLATEPMHKPKVRFGTIVSNDVFSSSLKLRQQVRSMFGADAMDMESAAAAQICYQQQVPFIAVRSVTDRGDEQSGFNYERWRAIASDNAASIGAAIIRSQANE